MIRKFFKYRSGWKITCSNPPRPSATPPREGTTNHTGQSVVEIVVALAIFVFLVAALGSLLLGGFSSLERSTRLIQARALGQEGVEAVRAIRNRDWNELVYGRSGVEVSGGRWIFSGEGTTEEIGRFTRTIDFEPVYRDADGQLAEAGEPGAARDASSTKVTVGISWEIGPGVNGTENRTAYLVDANAD
jgi:hypothetical protein